MNAKSVEEAVFWLNKYPEKSKAIAGGTDLLGLMKDRVEGPELTTPEVLVNIKSIPRLNHIAYKEKEGLKIGAAVTLDRLGQFVAARSKFVVLSEAARQVGTPQIRNMGTVGGNVCQRPQCMYFRHPHFSCFKKGGTKCYAVAGEHRHYHSILKHGICVMAHPSDMAPALTALKAKAIIASPKGEKQVALEEFFVGPNNHTETVMKPNELLTEFEVPHQKEKCLQLFLKRRIRHTSDFALCSVATVAQMSKGTCEDIRIVLGGVAPFPYIVFKAEEMIRGKELDDSLIYDAAEASVEEARPLPMNQYKTELTKAMITRALTSIRNTA